MPRLLLLLLATAALAAAEPAGGTRVVIATSLGDITAELFDQEAPQTVAAFTGLAEGTRGFTGPDGAEVRRPFYDGLVFHRVIAGFMIQGGCPLGTGAGGPGFTVPDEINGASLGLDRETVLVGGDLNPACAYQAREVVRLVLDPLLAARGAGPGADQARRQAALPQALRDAAGTTLMDFYQRLGYRYDSALPPSHHPRRHHLAMANRGPASNGSQFFITLADTPHLAGKHTVFGRVVAGGAVADAIGAVPVDEADRPREPVVIRSVRRAEVSPRP